MTAIHYPIAPNAEAALAAPIGRATREREAQQVAGEPVVFVTEPAGPAFATREAALDAYAGRVEDERLGGAGVAVEDRYCSLVESLAPGAARPAAARPTFAEGRRWPSPAAEVRTTWRLSVSYWRLASAAPHAEPPQARRARRSRADLAPETLHAMARHPLRPVEPQRPLDIGLFETRLPESPHIVVPDE